LQPTVQTIDPNEHDRFVVTWRRRMRLSSSLESVDRYEFALADDAGDTPAFCHVRQRVSRSNVRIGSTPTRRAPSR
jgi:hypothetical protein